MKAATSALGHATRLKWAGAGALVFATGLPAAIETGFMNLNDLIQNPEMCVPAFSVAGAFVGLWITATYYSAHSVRHRMIAWACGVFTAATAALSVLQFSTVVPDTTALGTELIMDASFAICGALLGAFLGRYLQGKLQPK